MNEIEKHVGLRKEKRRDTILLKISLFLLLAGGLIGGIGFTTVIIENKEYDKCIENPLDPNWVEEDLEPIFMTTGVCCLNWEQQENHAYYDVEANGFYYRCHYAIHKPSLGLPHWKYINHVQIKWVE